MNSYFKECQKHMKKLHHISMAKFWKNYIYKDTSVCDKTPYHGLLMNKMPGDFIVYPDIFYKYKPHTLIEIGTGRGGSAIWFYELIRGKVITIDVNEPSDEILQIFKKKNISFIHDNAATHDVYEKVLKHVSGRTIIIDDGSHMINDIIDCFNMYSKLVPDNGFYIIEDGMSGLLFKDHPNRQPCMAIAHILHDGYDFELFTEYDKFMFTSLLRGILRRNKNGNNK